MSATDFPKPTAKIPSKFQNLISQISNQLFGLVQNNDVLNLVQLGLRGAVKRWALMPSTYYRKVKMLETFEHFFDKKIVTDCL
jgi:hypothetical protein